jgi:hypothetical protein
MEKAARAGTSVILESDGAVRLSPRVGTANRTKHSNTEYLARGSNVHRDFKRGSPLEAIDKR